MVGRFPHSNIPLETMPGSVKRRNVFRNRHNHMHDNLLNMPKVPPRLIVTFVCPKWSFLVLTSRWNTVMAPSSSLVPTRPCWNGHKHIKKFHWDRPKNTEECLSLQVADAKLWSSKTKGDCDSLQLSLRLDLFDATCVYHHHGCVVDASFRVGYESVTTTRSDGTNFVV